MLRGALALADLLERLPWMRERAPAGRSFGDAPSVAVVQGNRQGDCEVAFAVAARYHPPSNGEAGSEAKVGCWEAMAAAAWPGTWEGPSRAGMCSR